MDRVCGHCPDAEFVIRPFVGNQNLALQIRYIGIRFHRPSPSRMDTAIEFQVDPGEFDLFVSTGWYCLTNTMVQFVFVDGILLGSQCECFRRSSRYAQIRLAIRSATSSSMMPGQPESDSLPSFSIGV